MKLQVSFSSGISVSGIASGLHPISLLPVDRATELEKRVKGIALGMNRRYGIDPEDLFQEGMAGICRKFRIGDTVGGMIMMARFAMRDFVRKEFDELHARREAAEIMHLVRSTSRTFEQLEECLQKLPEYDCRIMRMWLDGETPTSIGRKLGHDCKFIKKRIGLAAGAIAQCLGRGVNVECLWPVINRGLPRGVYFRHGKFVVRLGKAGKRYLGTFDTLSEAVDALSNA